MSPQPENPPEKVFPKTFERDGQAYLGVAACRRFVEWNAECIIVGANSGQLEEAWDKISSITIDHAKTKEVVVISRAHWENLKEADAMLKGPSKKGPPAMSPSQNAAEEIFRAYPSLVAHKPSIAAIIERHFAELRQAADGLEEAASNYKRDIIRYLGDPSAGVAVREANISLTSALKTYALTK